MKPIRFGTVLGLLLGLLAVCCLGGEPRDNASPVRSVGSIAQSIVNGQETDWQMWRGVVAVIYEKPGGGISVCTGTLIHPQVVLAAGHCVHNTEDEPKDLRSDPSPLIIRGGADARYNRQNIARVETALVHPTWAGVFQYGAIDLALLHLSESVDYLPNHCLRLGAAANVGDSGIIVGYGQTFVGDSTSTHRFGETTVLDVTAESIEIGGQSTTCEGDSGGPLFVQTEGKWRIAGVTSTVTADCNTAGGAFLVNVANYTDWIIAQVNEWTGASIGDNCSASDMDDEPVADCGTIGGECCGIGLCLDHNARCIADIPTAGQSACRAECEPPACTTLEGLPGYCHTMDTRSTHHCEPEGQGGDEPQPPACSVRELCVEGECVRNSCFSTDCSAQSSCPDRFYCHMSRVNGEVSGGVCLPHLFYENQDPETSTDAGASADAGADAGAAGATDPPISAGTGGGSDPTTPPAAGAAGDTPPPPEATGGAGAAAGVGGAGGAAASGAGGTPAGTGSGATAAAAPYPYAGSGGRHVAGREDDGKDDEGGGCSVSRVGSGRPVVGLSGLLLLMFLVWKRRELS